MGQDCACAHLTNTVPAFLASSHKSNDRCEYKSKGQQKQGEIAFFHDYLLLQQHFAYHHEAHEEHEDFFLLTSCSL